MPILWRSAPLLIINLNLNLNLTWTYGDIWQPGPCVTFTERQCHVPCRIRTARAADEFLPGGRWVGVGAQHVGRLEQQDRRLLDAVQRRRHVLLQDLVLTVVDRLVPNLKWTKNKNGWAHFIPTNTAQFHETRATRKTPRFCKIKGNNQGGLVNSQKEKQHFHPFHLVWKWPKNWFQRVNSHQRSERPKAASSNKW